jgi:hypothetical protein
VQAADGGGGEILGAEHAGHPARIGGEGGLVAGELDEQGRDGDPGCAADEAGKLFAWTSAIAHQPDLGGVGLGSFSPAAQDVFSESLPTPPVKVVRDGQLQRDVAGLWVRRSRVPLLIGLDLRAKIGANNVGRERPHALIDQYGADTVKAVMKRMMNDAEARLRDKLAALPDGNWSATGYQDQSHEGDRGLHKITVTTTKAGDHLTFDFTGTDPQAGVINCTYAGLRGGVMLALLPILAGDIPWSAGGLMRCFDLVAEEGPLNNATFPAAVSRGPIGPAWLTGSLVAECLSGMLDQSLELGKKAVAQNAGLCGGHPGNTGLDVIARNSRIKEMLADGQLPSTLPEISDTLEPGQNYATSYLAPGEVFTMTWQGGGGYGDPLTREPDAVARDVQEQKVTAEAARAVYGVIVEDGVVDPAATTAERDQHRARRRERSRIPGEPAARPAWPRPAGSTTTSSRLPLPAAADRSWPAGTAPRSSAALTPATRLPSLSTRGRPPRPGLRSSPTRPTTWTRPSCSASTAAPHAGPRCTRPSSRRATPTRSPASAGSPRHRPADTHGAPPSGGWAWSAGRHRCRQGIMNSAVFVCRGRWAGE